MNLKYFNSHMKMIMEIVVVLKCFVVGYFIIIIIQHVAFLSRKYSSPSTLTNKLDSYDN